MPITITKFSTCIKIYDSNEYGTTEMRFQKILASETKTNTQKWVQVKMKIMQVNDARKYDN